VSANGRNQPGFSRHPGSSHLTEPGAEYDGSSDVSSTACLDDLFDLQSWHRDNH
jgi:hypothetical protein